MSPQEKLELIKKPLNSKTFIVGIPLSIFLDYLSFGAPYISGHGIYTIFLSFAVVLAVLYSIYPWQIKYNQNGYLANMLIILVLSVPAMIFL